MENFYKRMRRFQYTTAIPLMLMVMDVILIFFVSETVASYWWEFKQSSDISQLLPLIISLSWLFSSLIFSAYQVDQLGTFRKILYFFTNSFILHICILLLFFTIKGTIWLYWQSLCLHLILSALAILALRIVLLRFYRVYRSLPFNHKNVIIIGDTIQTYHLFNFFTQNASLSQKLKGIFSHTIPRIPEMASFYKGGTEKVEMFCLENNIKEIYISLPTEREYLNQLQDFAERHFIYLGIVPDLEQHEKKKLGTRLFNDGRIPVFSYRDTPLRLLANWQVKRIFDIFFSFVVLLVLCFTLFPIIYLLIKLDSPGPVFFKQLRPGRNNNLFWCYKFRTMKINQEEHKQASKNDTRITRVGKFLRKTSLDELPQFYNVLKGDMSVVGPRPNMQNQLVFYSQHIPDYCVRHTISPGITGYAQVNGFRGETPELYLMEKRVEYDLIYLQKWSLLLDIKIIWLTVVNILKGEENAY